MNSRTHGYTDPNEWYRDEYKDRLDEIETRREYEERNGLKQNVLSTRFRDYADRIPGLVMKRWRSGSYPEDVYVSAELDEFMASFGSSRSPRSALELAQSDVARYERGSEAAEKRVAKRQKDLDSATRAWNEQMRKLRGARKELDYQKKMEAASPEQ